MILYTRKEDSNMDRIVRDFGNYIKERRLEKGMSQEEVAKKLNISQQAYSRYEHGDREPGLQTIYDLAAILDFAPGDFFNSYR